MLPPIVFVVVVVVFQLTPVKSAVMHLLAQEIQGFSKNRLKKQCTRVTTVTGRKLLERRSDGGQGEEQVEELEEGDGCGFVEDKSLDLQVGVIRPFLLLGNIFHEYFYIVYHIIESLFLHLLLPPTALLSLLSLFFEP